MPVLTPVRFVVLYSLHILTTILVPVVLLVLGLINHLQTVSLILLLAGVWALVGTIFMMSKDTRPLRRAYAIFAIIILVIAVFVYVVSL